jgi:hypothetical protein
MVFNPNLGSLVLLAVAGVLGWLAYTLFEDMMYKARTGRRRWEDED